MTVGLTTLIVVGALMFLEFSKIDFKEMDFATSSGTFFLSFLVFVLQG